MRPLWPRSGWPRAPAPATRAWRSATSWRFASRERGEGGRLLPLGRLERDDGGRSRGFGLTRPGLVGREALGDDRQVRTRCLRGVDHLPVEAGDPVQAVDPIDRVVDRSRADEDGHRVARALFVEQPQPAGQPLLRDLERVARETQALLGLGPLRGDRLPLGPEALERASRLDKTRRKRDGAEPRRPRLILERGVLVPQLLSPLLQPRRRPCADRRGQLQSGQSDHRRGYEPSSQPPTWLSHGGQPNTSPPRRRAPTSSQTARC